MVSAGRISELNVRLFGLLSGFLNDSPDMISGDMVEEYCRVGDCDKQEAYSFLLAAACGLDLENDAEAREIFFKQLRCGIHHLSTHEYEHNPYYENIAFPAVEKDGWKMCKERYEPYQAFVCDDIVVLEDGRQIPQVGFFDRAFEYPAVMQNGRIWMTVTPNEVETMRDAVERAHGSVLTYGLGLGYYVYMVSRKSSVRTVTVVEKDRSAIDLFEKHILPQFEFGYKIRTVCADAFEFAEGEMCAGRYDFVFTDLWHDVSDGLPMYLRMKECEKFLPEAEFTYWIERSIECYL